MTARVFPVYLEVAPKRTFACAVDWPGWARHGRTEDEALASLLEYGPRYAHALKGSRLGFTAPVAPAQLAVVERLTGNATTEFGAPAVAPSCDAERLCDAATLKRFEAILRCCWRAFDAAVAAARVEATREAIVAALRASAAGEIAEARPRGGLHWTARYGARRIAWHVLAHAWEIGRRASVS